MYTHTRVYIDYLSATSLHNVIMLFMTSFSCFIPSVSGRFSVEPIIFRSFLIINVDYWHSSSFRNVQISVFSTFNKSQTIVSN